MRTHNLAALGATALLALALAGCAPAAETSTGTDTGSDDTTTETDSGSDSSGVIATFPGTGEYQSGDTMPIGSYQLQGEPTEQPDGCTWTLYTADGDLFAENQGSYMFITDVTGKFVTNGCPDWEQYQ